MKILVTGAEGQLGRSIQELAKKHDYLDFVFTDYNELDITNSTKINEFFLGDSFDYCINCAAYTAVDKAETDNEKAFLINAEAVKNLAKACKANNVVLIQISTDFVFDGLKETPYNEEDEPNPLNIYGDSKLKGEKHVLDILKKFFIIRTSWVYSEYGHNFLKTMLRLGSEKKELSIVCDQIGTPTYAKDLANVLLTIIKEEKSEYGIYHYSNEGIASWYDFATAIFDISNTKIRLLPITTVAYPTPAKRPRYSVIDKSKLKRTLGIEIPNWRKSLGNCLKELKNG